MRKQIYRISERLGTGKILLGVGLAEELLNGDLPGHLKAKLNMAIQMDGNRIDTFPDFRIKDRVGLSNAYMEGFAAIHGQMYRPIQRELRGTIEGISDGDQLEILVLWDEEKVNHRHSPDDLRLVETC